MSELAVQTGVVLCLTIGTVVTVLVLLGVLGW